MEELYSSRFHETWRNTIPPGFMKPGGIVFFNEPQLFVFLKDHRNFEISIQTSFSLLTKKFLNPSGHPSKYWLGSQLLNFLIDASHSCDIAICCCLKLLVKLLTIYVRSACERIQVKVNQSDQVTLSLYAQFFSFKPLFLSQAELSADFLSCTVPRLLINWPSANFLEPWTVQLRKSADN